jgi:transposase
MERGIKLTEEQRNELDQLRLRTPSADVFRNCLIILMSDSRETIASIARRLGYGADTIVRVRRLYRKGGIKALYPIKPPGRSCRATPEFISQMRKAVQTNPLALGYGFSIWSAARLAEHLSKVTAIRFSDDQLRRLLYQQGFSVHRPKHTPKGKRDEAAYEKVKKTLVCPKKSNERRCQGDFSFPGRTEDSSSSNTDADVVAQRNSA